MQDVGLNVDKFFKPDSRDAIASKKYSQYHSTSISTFFPVNCFSYFAKDEWIFFNMKTLDYYFP